MALALIRPTQLACAFLEAPAYTASCLSLRSVQFQVNLDQLHAQHLGMHFSKELHLLCFSKGSPDIGGGERVPFEKGRHGGGDQEKQLSFSTSIAKLRATLGPTGLPLQ